LKQLYTVTPTAIKICFKPLFKITSSSCMSTDDANDDNDDDNDDDDDENVVYRELHLGAVSC